MELNLFDIIKDLEKMGKYKQADLVDNYIKLSQYAPPRSNLRNIFQNRSILDPIGFQIMQQSFTPGINIGGQSRSPNMSNPYFYQMSPQELQQYKYNPEYIAQRKQGVDELMAGLAVGRGLSDFQNTVKVVLTSINNLQNQQKSMGRPLTNQQLGQMYNQRFNELIQQKLETLIDQETNLNNIWQAISALANAFRFPEVTGQNGTIQIAIRNAMQRMSPMFGATMSPQKVAKYNQIAVDPRFKQFLPPGTQPITLV